MLSVLLILVHSPVLTEEPYLRSVRALFLESGNNASACRELNTMLSRYNEMNNPVLGAYRACAVMMMAQHVLNPVSKLSFFNSGRDLLEKCIAADATNPELRYLRFAMQSEAPFFPGCRQSVAADKTFIINNFRLLEDKQLKDMIAAYFIKSKFLSEDEKKYFYHE